MSTRDREEDEATHQAAYWLLALEEEPADAALRARFEAWLAESPMNRVAWASTSEVYDFIGTPGYVAHRAAREARRGEPARPASLSPRRPFRRRVALAVAATAMAACLAFLALPGLLLRLEADHMTATAETRSLALEDGSIIALAPGSAIEVVPGPDRIVRLLRGEALFEVKHDPGRPFRVLANAVETTVFGTQFDVRLQDGGAVVAVREGTVRVDRAGASPVSERLQAGDWVSVAAAARVERGAVPPDEVAAWRVGRIIARDRSIADVVNEIRRSYSGIIVLSGEAFGRNRITGVYNLADPVTALRAAVGVYGGTVRQVSPWLLIVSGG